ncbi:hypothetical protein [Streptomyces hainanensis]|uniref:Metallophosphoesterase n=1 Tax=Streptomyces hainanensis TaxID=402648 RepID=A0A4R4SKB1_9ACTN|nr:hypothetical protein [Streptomyces hainanensis]TDC62699.1 hypothetical protein E1283_33635 [Streptomyces hainanensis]
MGLGFVAVVSVLVVVVHRYLWVRLVRDVSRPGGWYRRIGTVLLWVLPIVSMITVVGDRVLDLPFPLVQALAWPGNYWYGSLLYILLTLALCELLRPLAMRVRWPRPASGGDPGPGGVRGSATDSPPGPPDSATDSPSGLPDSARATASGGVRATATAGAAGATAPGDDRGAAPDPAPGHASPDEAAPERPAAPAAGGAPESAGGLASPGGANGQAVAGAELPAAPAAAEGAGGAGGGAPDPVSYTPLTLPTNSRV